MVFLKEFFEKVDFDRQQKSIKKFAGGKELKISSIFYKFCVSLVSLGSLLDHREE